MKLSNIILEIKKIPFGTNTVDVSIPSEYDTLNLGSLTFTEQKIDFKLDKKTNRAIPTFKHRLAGGNTPHNTSLVHYLKRFRDSIYNEHRGLGAKEKKHLPWIKLDPVKYGKYSEDITDILNKYKTYLSEYFPNDWFEIKKDAGPEFDQLKDFHRVKVIQSFLDNYKGFKDYILDPNLSEKEHAILLTKSIPMLLDNMRNKVDPADVLTAPGKRGKLSPEDYADAKSGRFLRTHKFEVKFDSQTLKNKEGLYIWVIGGEVRYVGLTTNFKSRPGSDYTSPDAWNSAFGSTGNRLNAYISKQLERLKDPKKANTVIRVFTAPIPKSNVEGFKDEFLAQKKTGNDNEDNYYKQKYLTTYESAVKRWSGNLDSGKFDASLHKPKPGRGSYGKSGNLNKADIT